MTFIRIGHGRWSYSAQNTSGPDLHAELGAMGMNGLGHLGKLIHGPRNVKQIQDEMSRS